LLSLSFKYNQVGCTSHYNLNHIKLTSHSPLHELYVFNSKLWRCHWHTHTILHCIWHML